MHKNLDAFGERAVLFVRELLQIYLEARDLDRMLPMLHQDISWLGTGAHERGQNHLQVAELLWRERDLWGGCFKINEQAYQAAPLDDRFCMVYGELKLEEDGPATILMHFHLRFSFVCILDGAQCKLYHGHFSVPSSAQGQGGFVHKTLAEKDNPLLEQKLLERTRMLREKTRALEALANNIYGGVEVCSDNGDYTIEYVSDGFVRLTGYSREELASLLQNKHGPLVYEEDRQRLCDEIARQLEHANSFSVEYRLVRRDGTVIWVLDNGNRIKDAKVQCILTDITARKRQEEALRISEKRYEIALQLLNVAMFEYNILTGELVLYQNDADLYGMPTVIPDGVETLISRGFILPRSVAGYREMYRRICAGAPFAKCYITSKDTKGCEHEYELSLTSVFDHAGKPIRAIGVKRNASQLRSLQKEQEFGQTLVADKNFVCEADVTADRLVQVSEDWLESVRILPGAEFSRMVQDVCDRVIAQEHREMVRQQLSAAYITRQFAEGKKLFSFCYQGENPGQGYTWFEATINMIQDHGSGDINIRFYNKDITARKNKEQKALEEQQLYETMIAKAMSAYEINITKDIAQQGHAKGETDLPATYRPHRYRAMIRCFAQRAVCPEDGVRLAQDLDRGRILAAFQRGVREFTFQYRRLQPQGGLLWINCVLHLYEDPQTGEVKGFCYVEDIDKQKRAELALRFKAEHDSLTGLYNKEMAERLVNAFFAAEESRTGTHAFLMIDLDYFKTINDRFGHAFGDKVLFEIAQRMIAVFDEGDMVGRIGGDEFCVLAKNLASPEEAARRAGSVCSALLTTYTQGEESCTISASVGVVLCRWETGSYSELYRRADAALYRSKRNGRNRFSL